MRAYLRAFVDACVYVCVRMAGAYVESRQRPTCASSADNHTSICSYHCSLTSEQSSNDRQSSTTCTDMFLTCADLSSDVYDVERFKERLPILLNQL